MTQNVFKAVAICLHPECPQPSRYVKDINIKHNTICSKHIFSLQQLLTSSSLSLPQYPVTQLGRIVKQKLISTKRLNSQSYLDVIIEDFKQTISKIMDKIKDELVQLYPSNYLQKCYNDVYSLQPIKQSIKNQQSSSLITQQLKFMHSSLKINKLKESNFVLDNVNVSLNQIIEELTVIINGFKQNILMIKKDTIEKSKRIELDKMFSNDQIVYKMCRTNYEKGKDIRFEGGQIIFPSCREDSFKPWVYSQKGFSTGVHKLKLISTLPQVSKNCGIAIIKQSDIDTYPYSIYKSLYDRVTRQFKLSKGQQFYRLKQQMLQIVVVMDLNQKKATITDTGGKTEYVCALKQSTIYYFGIVGTDWRVRVMHLS